MKAWFKRLDKKREATRHAAGIILASEAQEMKNSGKIPAWVCGCTDTRSKTDGNGHLSSKLLKDESVLRSSLAELREALAEAWSDLGKNERKD